MLSRAQNAPAQIPFVVRVELQEKLVRSETDVPFGVMGYVIGSSPPLRQVEHALKIYFLTPLSRGVTSCLVFSYKSIDVAL